MQIRLANPRGFCAGVDRAIEIVNRALDVFGAPIYVRHEVVHNKFVVDNLRNRGAGPFSLLNVIDDRCGGEFDQIDDVVPPRERDEIMSVYKKAAGFAIQTLNAASPTIAPGATVAEYEPN